MKKYDIAVIGSGAGLMVVEAALARGLSCALIEKSKFGGTCLTKGCIPSKMLVYPADMIREAQDARRVGLGFAPPEVDWALLSKRMWRQINYSAEMEKELKQAEGLDVYAGTGSFIGPRALRVEYPDGAAPAEFEAEKIVIAAGARSFVPPIAGLQEAGYLTSERFFGDGYPQKPWTSLVIIGGGAIGAEFAHIFSAFGTKVTLVEMKDRILPTEEEEVSAFVEKQFRGYGIDVVTGAKALSAARGEAGKILAIENAKTGARREIVAEEIFVSSGVRSNADLLNLAAAGIRADARGWIEVDEYLETSQPGVYAVGDINGKYQFRHKANYEATILNENLFGGSDRKAAYDAVPWAIFTHPQVGHVGLTEREAREKGLDVGVARNRYSSIAGGIAMGLSQCARDDGFAKIILTRDRKIVGAHVVGPHAAMLVQPFVYLMNAGVPCRELPYQREKPRQACFAFGSVHPIMDSMVIHPSMSELMAWAIEDVEFPEN